METSAQENSGFDGQIDALHREFQLPSVEWRVALIAIIAAADRLTAKAKVSDRPKRIISWTKGQPEQHSSACRILIGKRG
jgi:hypothetical protein